ncbi:MAG: serine/threonine-protein kinase [Myxococcota bacterium]
MDDAHTFDRAHSDDTRTVAGGATLDDERERERVGLERGATLGRYLVIEQVGQGGMGVVVRAYDPKLHREIALKRLHRDALDSDGEARLLREAQAMARLSHPNVVTIYDVERTDEGVVMAMEFAEGQTLKQWIATGPHPWRKILSAFEQAGRGLRAAHEAGLVHRDFKPSNAIMGPDGRVRVMDFGLARSERGPSSANHLITQPEGEASAGAGGWPAGGFAADVEQSVSGSLDIQLTQEGAIMGTPSYMSTEQHRGETADARSDQYAFCVSLWEALSGERPFRGDFRGIVLAKHQGPPPVPRGSRVPRSIYEALRRGMSVRAGERWPSIAALLEALADDPARRRRQRMVTGGLVLTLGGLGALAVAAWPEASPPPCQDAAAQLEGAWDDARRAEVRAALHKTALSYADPTWTRVSERLDAYANAWVRMYTEACEATAVLKVQSGALLDQRMQCLRRRRLRLEATVDVLADANAEVAKTAIEQVTGLPTLDRCADVDALTAAVPPPEDPQVAKAVEQVRDELTRALALVAGGRYDDARARLTDLVERSAGLDYAPVHAEVLSESAGLARLQGRYEQAVDEATRAYRLALTAGANLTASEAASSVMFVTGHRQAKIEVGRAWGVSARALAQRSDPTGVREALVLNNLGAVAYRDGDFALATSYFQQALPMLERALGEHDDRIATSLNHLGIMLDEQGRYADAEPHFRRALAIHTEVFGPEHPRPTLSMDNLALCLQAQGRNEDARDLHRRALAIRTKALDADHPDVGLTENNLGWDYMGMNEPQTALEHFVRAHAVFVAAYGPTHPRVAMTLESRALAQTKLEHFAEAEGLHRRALEMRRATLGEDHPNVALSLAGLGVVATEQGRHEQGIEMAREALKILEARDGNERQVADVLTHLGKALLAAERFDEAESPLLRALELMEQGGSTDPVVLAKVHMRLAQAAWGAERPDDAHARAQRGLLLLRGREDSPAIEMRESIDVWQREHPRAPEEGMQAHGSP